MSTATFFVGLVADASSSPLIFRVKTVLSTSSLPLSTLITTLYWSLRAVDPDLVVPPDLMLPLTADLGFHLAPTLFLLTDFLFLSPPWTITVVPSVVLSSSIALTYWIWIERCFGRNGFYPYPLFALLDTTQRVGLFVGCALGMAGMTAVLKKIYGAVNGVELKSEL